MSERVEVASTDQLLACPLCEGKSLRKIAVPGNWIGHEVFSVLKGTIGLDGCRSCGLVFTNPRPSSAMLSAFYSGDTYTCHEVSGSASAGAKADYILKRVTEYLPQTTPRTLLDFGAGSGGFLSYARDCGWNVRGFEPGRRGLESCRKLGLEVSDNLGELPQGEFSLVTLHHVFEHLANPISVLEEISRFLTKEGRLFIEVPNVRSLRARLSYPILSKRFRFDERYRAYPIHLMYYSHQTLRKVLNRAGWTVERTFTVGLGLDELVIRPETPRKENACTGKTRPTTAKRKWRHFLRDAFLGLGIGENLAAIAYPNRQ